MIKRNLLVIKVELKVQDRFAKMKIFWNKGFSSQLILHPISILHLLLTTILKLYSMKEFKLNKIIHLSYNLKFLILLIWTLR